MAVLMFLLLICQWTLSENLQTAALEPVHMYDYDQHIALGQPEVKRSVKRSAEEYDDGNDDNDDDDDNDDEESSNEPDGANNDWSRSKRNLTSGDGVTSSQEKTSTASTTNSGQSNSSSAAPGVTSSNVTGNVTTAQNTTSKPKTGKHQTTATTTAPPDDYDPDFHLGHRVMDAIFLEAEKNDMKQTLGLCRKNGEVKIPEVKATLFPAEQAGDILNCINDLLKNQAKKQMCLHLDPEMNAYLRWLILTGEAKEKHKPPSIVSKEDFLFPSSCGTEAPQAQFTPECLVEPVVRENFQE